MIPEEKGYIASQDFGIGDTVMFTTVIMGKSQIEERTLDKPLPFMMASGYILRDVAKGENVFYSDVQFISR